MNKTAIGKFLKELREERGLTQIQLSQNWLKMAVTLMHRSANGKEDRHCQTLTT